MAGRAKDSVGATAFQADLPILTFQFIADHLDLLSKFDFKQFNQILAEILSGPWSSASDLALKIITERAEQELTLPELRDVDLRKANLQDRKIQGLHCQTLLLDITDAYESKWVASSFQRIEIGQGNISGSLWRDCSWLEFIDIEAVREPPLQNDVTLANCRGNIKLSRLHIFPSSSSARMTESFFQKDFRQGHAKWVRSCCFSPDGTRILSASSDKTLKLWDAQGRCLQTFQGHVGRILSCCFSPNGTRILSASSDKTLKLWDAQGRCLQTFQGHVEWVWICCFSLDGTRILSASSDKTLKLWDVQGQCLQTFQGHEGGVNSCCFNPDGSRILSASSDETLKFWDLTDHCLQTFQGHEGGVNSCCFSPDGSRILSASQDGTLRLWNLDGTVERIFAAWEEQWYTAFFRNNQLEKIIGTEMSWKMAHFAKDGKTWTLDETGCFEWVPAQY